MTVAWGCQSFLLRPVLRPPGASTQEHRIAFPLQAQGQKEENITIKTVASLTYALQVLLAVNSV